MSYGWATVFTLAAWFAGLVIDVNVRVGDLGLRTVLSRHRDGLLHHEIHKGQQYSIINLYYIPFQRATQNGCPLFLYPKIRKGGRPKCQAKPKNISPLPSARPMALTRYWESWTDYLTTASRLYKYPFADQLMIYAQRPDATACADYDIWNNRMNRYVRRGSKGIASAGRIQRIPASALCV